MRVEGLGFRIEGLETLTDEVMTFVLSTSSGMVKTDVTKAVARL